jgi:hypothetical protein
MTERAAHLVDEVLPWVSMRHAYGRVAPGPTAMAPALVAGSEGTKGKLPSLRLSSSMRAVSASSQVRRGAVRAHH